MRPWMYVVLILLALTGIGLFSFMIYKSIESHKKMLEIEKSIVEQKTLMDGITRSSSQYMTKKDLEDFGKSNNLNLDTIKKDLEKLNGTITSINKVSVITNGFTGSNLPSNSTIANPTPTNNTVACNGEQKTCPDPFGFQKNSQFLNLNEPIKDQTIPIGKVGFSAWQKNPWQLTIHPREYKMYSVVGTDEQQRQYFYNKVIVNVEGKDHVLDISKTETKQEYPEPKFTWFNPRIFLGIDGGMTLTNIRGEFTPSLHFGVASYGRYKNQPDFSILQLGIGIGTVKNNVHFYITPFAYNFGKHLPFLNNLYIAPSVSFNTGSEVLVMLGLRVAL